MKMMSWAGRKILERTLKLSNHPSSQCLRKITSNSVLYTASNNKKELSSDDVVSFKAMLPELINELRFSIAHSRHASGKNSSRRQSGSKSRSSTNIRIHLTDDEDDLG